MRVVLADDHQLVRAGLRALLQSFADVEVLAECGDGHEALAVVDRTQPDVLLLDITLPGLNGLDVAQRVPKLSPPRRRARPGRRIRRRCASTGSARACAG